MIAGSVAARTAEAPPGGCTVLVSSMTAEERPHATAPASHWRDEKSGWSWKSLDMETPIRAEKMWPRRALRGWPRGERMALYSRIAEAPYASTISNRILKVKREVDLGMGTYKRSNQRRRMMALYTLHPIKHARYNRQPTKRAYTRPKRAQHITDILFLLFPISQEPRDIRREFVQW
jgi:hypothetical protein